MEQQQQLPRRRDARRHKEKIGADGPVHHAHAAASPTIIFIGAFVTVFVVTIAILFYRRRRRKPNYDEILPMISEAAKRRQGFQAEDSDNDESLGPRPLPPPSVLDNRSAPPPPPQYSHLELRQLEADGDTSHCWGSLPSRHVAVRGAHFLRDGRKVPSEPHSSCLAVELFRSASVVYDVASRADSPVHSLQSRSAQQIAAPIFVANLIIPATDGFYQLVLYFGLLRDERPSAASTLYERFINGTDAFRNARLKLIPSVAEGPWLVQSAVGSRPAILGKALKQRFSKGEGHFEVAIDCNSSPAAGRIVSLVKSYARSLVVDLAFVIEAQTADELPERVLGCVRMLHIDLSESGVPEFVQGAPV
jgi:hypothetical protein